MPSVLPPKQVLNVCLSTPPPCMCVNVSVCQYSPMFVIADFCLALPGALGTLEVVFRCAALLTKSCMMCSAPALSRSLVFPPPLPCLHSLIFKWSEIKLALHSTRSTGVLFRRLLAIQNSAQMCLHCQLNPHPCGVAALHSMYLLDTCPIWIFASLLQCMSHKNNGLRSPQPQDIGQSKHAPHAHSYSSQQSTSASVAFEKAQALVDSHVTHFSARKSVAFLL